MGNGGNSSSARWAADPSGRHAFRFWDGSRWTGHVSDAPVAPSKVPGTPEAPGTPPVTEAVDPASPPAIGPPIVVPDQGDSHDTTGERPESGRRQQRLAARKRKSFWLGVLTGAAVVVVIAVVAAAIAVVALGVKVSTSSTAKRTKAPSTTVAPPTSSLATTTTTNAGRAPTQVRVEVINAQAVPNAAGAKALALGRLGYQNAGLADAPVRQGTAVQCKPGFEAEAATLSKAVGVGTSVEPFPNPPPAGSTNADCVVILGK
jgi:uncharacterized protein DUF2510/LytR cell envelope-related transcriptional attenuator